VRGWSPSSPARPERSEAHPLAPSVAKRSRGAADDRPRLRAFSATLGLNDGEVEGPPMIALDYALSALRSG